jgi:N-acetyl-anhydromuramyl-L-alanine amidase AmpD
VGTLRVALISFAVGVAASLVVMSVTAAPAARPQLALRAPADDPAPSTLPEAGGRGGGAATPQPAQAAAAAQRAEPQGRAAAPAVAFPYRPQPEWLPSSPNRDIGRGDAPVRYVVIHYTAISYERTLKAFTLPSSGVSAHYIVRRDGHVAQMVGEADTAWHAGNYWYNQRSVGIELELDPVTNPAYTPQQYYAAAALTCAIAGRHGIPLDRAHIVGHNEIPGTRGKIDPGPTWGWPHFMWLTSLCAPPTAATVHAQWVSQSAFPTVHVGDSASVSVSLRNTGATAWVKGSVQEARLGIRGNRTDLAFLGPAWPAADRPAVQNEPIVPPGAVATFTFSVFGEQPGTFTIPLRGVVDGAAWMDDLGIYTQVTVKPRPPSEAESPITR